MPKYFLSGTKYEAFERMMMEVPSPKQHPEEPQKSNSKRGENCNDEQGKILSKERSK